MGSFYLKRIKKELEDIKSKNLENIIELGELTPINKNDLLLKAIIQGPIDSPYEGGKYHLNITFHSNYPFESPVCKFETKIFHTQIINNGGIYLDILRDQWSPAITIEKLLNFYIVSLFYLYYEEDRFLNEAAQILYKSNKYEYYKKARKWAIKYADAPKNGKVQINYELNFIKYDENFKLIKINFYKCKAIINSSKDSPYKDHEIELFFNFSEDYPLKPPSFSISISKNDKYLDFVEKLGNIIIKENWNKKFLINDILKLISNCLKYNFISIIDNIKNELKEKNNIRRFNQ